MVLGDYVMSTVPNTDSSMSSLAEDGIVILPTGDRTWSVRVYSIAKGKIAIRDQLRILSMPMSVVEHMNALATTDGRTLHRKHGVLSMPSVYDIPHMSRTTHHLLPDFFIPTVRSGTDLEVVIRDPAPPSVHELADESGRSPLDTPDAPNHARGGGVYPVDPYIVPPRFDDPPTADPEPPTDLELIGNGDASEENGGDTEIGGENEGDRESGGDRHDSGSRRQRMLEYFRNGAAELVQLVTRMRS
jgi:hypothetical protein